MLFTQFLLWKTRIYANVINTAQSVIYTLSNTLAVQNQSYQGLIKRSVQILPI